MLTKVGPRNAKLRVLGNWEHIVNLLFEIILRVPEKEKLMHDPSSEAANRPLAVKPGSGDINALEQEIPRASIQRQQRSRQAIDNEAERIQSAVMRLLSNSVRELEGLTAELQKLQEFLTCETERVQHEIDSVLSGVSVIIETIGPWKSPAASTIRNAPTNPGPSAREKLKRWPPAD